MQEQMLEATRRLRSAERADADKGQGDKDEAGGDDKNTLTPEEFDLMRTSHHVEDAAIRDQGPAHGLTSPQIEALLSGSPISITAPQRAEVDHALRAQPEAAVEQAEVLHGAWSGCAPTPATALQAPTAADLSTNPVVVAAMNAAWTDSKAADSVNRHEEGGWIYMDTTSGALSTGRAPAGAQAALDVNNPPVVAGSVVVGLFHTHPNPTSEGWEPGPSGADVAYHNAHGIPGVIKADDGIHTVGPLRRTSLSGPAGYPQ